MAPHRFNHLARDLGSGPASRRRLLRSVLAGGAAALAALLSLDRGRFGLETVSASGADRACRAAYDADPGSIVSKNACPATEPTRCGAGSQGFCVQAIGHIPRCVTGFDPTLGRERCPREDRCDRHGDCPKGSFCGKVEGCCGWAHNTCLRAFA